MHLVQSKIARAFCVSFALVGAISIGAVTLSTEMALAKNTNNSGNGNNGNHGNNGNNGSDHSAKPKKSDSGASASDLGALNAAHASANALLHANPNSRVGRIAIFRDAVLATGEIEADRDEAQAALDLLTPPTRPSSEVQGDIDLAEIALSDADGVVADLADNDPFDQAAYDLAVEDRDAIADGIVDLQTELASNLVYDTAAAELALLEASLLERPAIERELLEAAANKPVTDAVEAAVEDLLNLN